MTAHTDSPTLDSLRTLYRSMLLPAFALLVLALMWSAVVYQAVSYTHLTLPTSDLV